MRSAALLFVIAVNAFAAKAQFTLQPRVGVENPVTKISYNNSSFYKAVGQSLPQAGVVAGYQLKKGFTPFLGAFTHRPLVSYNFNDPATGRSDYQAGTGDLQVQLQAGLQYNTKAIALSKKATVKTNTQTVSETKSNGYRSYSGCSHKKPSETQAPKQQGNTWTLRLQPSAGIGYIPAGKQDVEDLGSASQASYRYNAGNLKTELIAGLGFEFAKNKNPFITLAVHYFKGLATNETVLTTEIAGSKPVSTNLRSKLSGWNAAIGIPISFAKKTKATEKPTSDKTSHPNCTQYYRSRCGSYYKRS